jgi:hypothetical protein
MKYTTKYNIEHLTQPDNQAVLGPLQDDEALLLYSLIKVTIMQKFMPLDL